MCKNILVLTFNYYILIAWSNYFILINFVTNIRIIVHN
jgi:hypothetical protein